jgi:sugar phosphate isomerase/epimerase
MSLGAHDAVFCTGTTRGVPFSTKAQAAAAAGFRAISIRPSEYDELRAQGRTPDQVRGFLDDLGLAVAELDPLWLPVAPPPHLPAHRTDEVLEMAQVLEPDCISVLVPFATADERGNRADAPLDLGRATVAFAELCDHPLAAGRRLAIEFFAWSPLHTLVDTWTIVRDADRANGGIILDTWHHTRRGGTERELALVDASRIWGVQIADAPAEPQHPDLAVECMRHRRWPGEGTVPLVAIVAELRAQGCTAPLGIEVFGSVDGDAEALARAHRAYSALEPLTQLPSRA